MSFNIIVRSVKPGKEKLLARKLAENPEISLQKAIELVDKLPVVYKKNIKRENLKPYVDSLTALGAEFDIVESNTEPIVDVGVVPSEEVDDIKSILISVETVRHASSVNTVHKESASTKEFKEHTIGNIFIDNKKNITPVYRLSIVVVIAFFAVLVYFLFVGQRKRSYEISNVDFSVVSQSAGKSLIHRSRKKSAKQIKRDIKESEGLVDSANLYSDDLEKMIKFYLIAISINEKNFNAWTGLLDAYKRAGKEKKAAVVENKIKEIFGDRVVSIRKLIKPYGKLITVSTENGVCSLKYKPSYSDIAKIKFDIFLITKALYSLKGVRVVSVFAETKRGSGVLVRVETALHVSEYSDFIQNAVINTVE